MRTLAIAALTVAVAAVAGWAAAVIHIRLDADAPFTLLAEKAGTRPPAAAAEPQIAIEEREFNFGTMQRGTKKTHKFLVRNTGAAPLTVKVGHTTCKCTLGVASDEPVAPGESTEVNLEWRALSEPGPFRQSATLLTNDPQNSQLTLTIVGEIVEAHGVDPPDFLLDKVSAGESKSASVYVMAMFQDTISVDRAEFTNAETRDQFDVRIEPVAKSDLPNPEAKAGVRIKVTVKPNAPLGFFSQRLRLHTNLNDAQELEIPVAGHIIGDISVHGENWDDEHSLLRIGGVRSSVGSPPARLSILVRGRAAEDVTFSVKSCDPPELKATIGEPKRLSDGLVQVPLEIIVPPGTPPMVRLGTDQGDDGHVILSTTHPTIRELRLNVRFSVER